MVSFSSAIPNPHTKINVTQSGYECIYSVRLGFQELMVSLVAGFFQWHVPFREKLQFHAQKER
jgi:hypothetical protein